MSVFFSVSFSDSNIKCWFYLFWKLKENNQLYNQNFLFLTLFILGRCYNHIVLMHACTLIHFWEVLCLFIWKPGEEFKSLIILRKKIRFIYILKENLSCNELKHCYRNNFKSYLKNYLFSFFMSNPVPLLLLLLPPSLHLTPIFPSIHSLEGVRLPIGSQKI